MKTGMTLQEENSIVMRIIEGKESDGTKIKKQLDDIFSAANKIVKKYVNDIDSLGSELEKLNDGWRDTYGYTSFEGVGESAVLMRRIAEDSKKLLERMKEASGKFNFDKLATAMDIIAAVKKSKEVKMSDEGQLLQGIKRNAEGKFKLGKDSRFVVHIDVNGDQFEVKGYVSISGVDFDREAISKTMKSRERKKFEKVMQRGDEQDGGKFFDVHGSVWFDNVTGTGPDEAKKAIEAMAKTAKKFFKNIRWSEVKFDYQY